MKPLLYLAAATNVLLLILGTLMAGYHPYGYAVVAFAVWMGTKTTMMIWGKG